MIYIVPEESSPIRQGDIFINVPSVELTSDPLLVPTEEGEGFQAITLEAFAASGQKITALIGIEPVVAIVGTQECDAIRAEDITLFRISPFAQVEGLAKSAQGKGPSSWVPIITKHARINYKWFYLPADEKVGFPERMGVDFLSPLRVPRVTLENLRRFRIARLNEIASQHFRERIAEFFRRYAYDEWYSLTPDELQAYEKKIGAAVEPFPWQIEKEESTKPPMSLAEATATATTQPDNEPGEETEKGLYDYQVGMKRALDELNEILDLINAENDSITTKIRKHTETRNALESNPTSDTPAEINTLYAKAAGDIHQFSGTIEKINIRFEQAVGALTENVEGLINWSREHGSDTKEDIKPFREQIKSLSAVTVFVGNTFRQFRDVANDLSNQRINAAMTGATRRQAAALGGVVANIERVETFCVSTLFLLDENFGGESDPNP